MRARRSQAKYQQYRRDVEELEDDSDEETVAISESEFEDSFDPGYQYHGAAGPDFSGNVQPEILMIGVTSLEIWNLVIEVVRRWLR
ncbi:hypothetical protein AA313_de0209531 [Arthrobotrys entomopaga]|nr:hypothetical protein AA313_de0209531 [Arthrobotrys entomopaga]